MLGFTTVKLEPEITPQGVVKETGPVVAPIGTSADTDVAVLSEKVALTPLKLTLVIPDRFVPVMVIKSWSIIPDVGEYEDMEAAGLTDAVVLVRILSHPFPSTQQAK
jgi:hypothetical protein